MVFDRHYHMCMIDTKKLSTEIPMPFTYAHARPALTVDAVVFGLDDENLKILLIRRAIEPFKGKWALPGGFVQVGESPEAGVARELAEETSLTPRALTQVGTYGDPTRDPREHVVTVAFFALVRLGAQKVFAATDAEQAAWFPLDEVPLLAFDHAKIVDDALARLRFDLKNRPLAFELLPEKFPLRALQALHEQVLGEPLDKRNFRRKALDAGLLVELDEWETDVQHRAARLYRFDRAAWKKIEKAGGTVGL